MSSFSQFGSIITKVDNGLCGYIAGLEQRRLKRNPVIRSLSDRRDKESQEVFSFKDTTALRKKSQRTIPSQLFQKPKNSIHQRPTCPPPMLPDMRFREILAEPQRPPRQQSNLIKFTFSIILTNFVCKLNFEK